MTDHEMRAACALILADPDETTEPCRYGHFDCARVNGGACSGEAFALVASRYPDARDLDAVQAHADAWTQDNAK